MNVCVCVCVCVCACMCVSIQALSNHTVQCSPIRHVYCHMTHTSLTITVMKMLPKGQFFFLLLELWQYKRAADSAATVVKGVQVRANSASND